MRYAKIREIDISNGEGIGVSLFVQGCHFHCRGCFNPETWDFCGGKEWNYKIKEQFIELANKPYITRISILGGEPLCDENVKEVLDLIKDLKSIYPNKKIWLYTGYNFDEILEKGNTGEKSFWKDRFDAISNVDIVIDGQFKLENQDLYNEQIIWAGSTNQRIFCIENMINSTIHEGID
ncbi:MAG: anaerobic ribonucleoside-triphosphate reductase activating protein [Eubacterium sp.]